MNSDSKPNFDPIAKSELPLPNASAKTQDQWRSYCSALLLEIERLRGENAGLQEQRRALAKMVPIPEDVMELADKSFEELMASCEGEPSLEDIINEIRNGQEW